MTGTWLSLRTDRARPGLLNCRLCGRSLFRQAWSASAGTEPALLCDPGCEELFHGYRLPRYGPATGATTQ